MAHGGARPNSGPKPGSQHEATIRANEEKQIARSVIRELVTAKLQPTIETQIQHAQGVSYMVLRAPDGSFARATDEKQIDAACAAGATAFRIFTQAPNTQAFVALWDRAYDKPSEHMEITGKDGGPVQTELILKAARLRLAKVRG